MYALLDAVVDHCFPILENYSDVLESLEQRGAGNGGAHMIHQIHAVKRELLLIRRETWPLREVVNILQRDETGILQESTRVYLAMCMTIPCR